MCSIRERATLSAVHRAPRIRGPFAFKTLVELALVLAIVRCDSWQVQNNRAFGQVGPLRKVVDPVQNHRPHRVENHLVGIRIQLPGRKPAPSRQPAKRIGQPVLDTGEVVVSGDPGINSGDEEIPVSSGWSPNRRHYRIDKASEELPHRALCRALLSLEHKDGVRSGRSKRRHQPSQT